MGEANHRVGHFKVHSVASRPLSHDRTIHEIRSSSVGIFRTKSGDETDRRPEDAPAEEPDGRRDQKHPQPWARIVGPELENVTCKPPIAIQRIRPSTKPMHAQATHEIQRLPPGARSDCSGPTTTHPLDAEMLRQSSMPESLCGFRSGECQVTLQLEASRVERFKGASGSPVAKPPSLSDHPRRALRGQTPVYAFRSWALRRSAPRKS